MRVCGRPTSPSSRSLGTICRGSMPLVLTRRSTLVVATLVAYAVSDDPAIIVDDADGRIQYSSSWLPVSAPLQNNYGGTLSFTNFSNSTATISFDGGESPQPTHRPTYKLIVYTESVIQLSVWGAFPVVGTFNMASQYNINGNSTITSTFTPMSTVSKPKYRQRFFLSPFMSPDRQTLTITNLGENFYLDHIILHLVRSPATDEPRSTLPTPLHPVQNSSHTSKPPASEGSPTTASAPSDTSQPSALSSTSSGAEATQPVTAVQTSNGLTTGAYIAVAIGGSALLLCMLAGALSWGRRRRRQAITPQPQMNINPYGEFGYSGRRTRGCGLTSVS